MANYYTKLSMLIPAPTPAAKAWLQNEADNAGWSNYDLEEDGVVPDSALCRWCVLMDEGHGLSLEMDDTGLTVSHDESANISAVAALLAEYTRLFPGVGVISAEWSDDCSRPIVGAYGGGALVAYRGAVSAATTWGILQRELNLLWADEDKWVKENGSATTG